MPSGHNSHPKRVDRRVLKQFWPFEAESRAIKFIHLLSTQTLISKPIVGPYILKNTPTVLEPEKSTN
jgi:hypothetical protein